jgi:hypothetical protein
MSIEGNPFRRGVAGHTLHGHAWGSSRMDDAVTTGPVSGLGASAAECLARARTLIPLLQSAAPRIDAGYELPGDVLDGMHGAGMFRLLIPRAYGGFELKPSDYVRCVEAIAIGDASAAWCMNQGSGCSMTAAYMAPEVSREIWGGKRDVLAWGQGPRGQGSPRRGRLALHRYLELCQRLPPCDLARRDVPMFQPGRLAGAASRRPAVGSDHAVPARICPN